MFSPVGTGALNLGLSALSFYAFSLLKDERLRDDDPLVLRVAGFAKKIGLSYPVHVYLASPYLFINLPFPIVSGFWLNKGVILLPGKCYEEQREKGSENKLDSELVFTLYQIQTHDLFRTNILGALASMLSVVALKVLIPSFKPLYIALLSLAIGRMVTEVFFNRWRLRVATRKTKEFMKPQPSRA